MLFGHQGDTAQHSATQVTPSQSAPVSQPAPQGPGTNPLAVDPDTGASYPAVQPDSSGPADSSPDAGPEPSVLDQPSTSDSAYQSFQSFSSDPAPTTPFGTDQAPQQPQQAPVDNAPAAAPAQAPDPSSGAPIAHLTPAFSDQSAATPTVPAPPAPAAAAPMASVSSSSDGLLDLKQQALNQLGPLISQLDQAPEEKFRTTMMLIQSTDNSTLLKQAYEAAQAIADERTRAQALLDVVNEINYFTQQAATDASTM